MSWHRRNSPHFPIIYACEFPKGSIPNPLLFFLRFSCGIPWPFLPLLLQFVVGDCAQNWIKPEINCCKNRTFYSSFFVPPKKKGSGRNGKAKPHQSGAILSQRWWAVHPQYQVQSIRHEEYVCFPAQTDFIWICVWCRLQLPTKLQHGTGTYQLQFKPDRKEGKQYRKHLSGRYEWSKGVDE